MHYAAAQGHMAVLEILIDEGKAKTTARDRNAHTAIDVVGAKDRAAPIKRKMGRLNKNRANRDEHGLKLARDGRRTHR